jgi:hypothetical protein
MPSPLRELGAAFGAGKDCFGLLVHLIYIYIFYIYRPRPPLITKEGFGLPAEAFA